MSENECTCIYFGNTKKELSYKKQEHVIPASLGGKTKLPWGVVSDQANEFFSKYEMKAVRNTLLSINRNNNGPGKRGSLSVKKVKSPQINLFEVIENEQDNNLDTKYAPVRLGFLFCGKVYMIPQILFLINNDLSIKLPRIVMDTFSENVLSSTTEFCMKLHNFILSNNKKYIIVNSKIKNQLKYIIIGMYDNRWFIYTSLSEEYIEKFISLLKQIPLPEKIPVLPSTVATYHCNNILPDALDDSFPLIYIKTAFNVLAFFNNCDFVLQSQFDDIRNAILNLNNLNDFFVEKLMPKWLIIWVNNEVKPKEHFVVINAENNGIEAYVSFYREPLTHTICLSDNYIGESFRKGFICDWSNGTERFLNV